MVNKNTAGELGKIKVTSGSLCNSSFSFVSSFGQRKEKDVPVQYEVYHEALLL